MSFLENKRTKNENVIEQRQVRIDGSTVKETFGRLIGEFRGKDKQNLKSFQWSRGFPVTSEIKLSWGFWKRTSAQMPKLVVV